MGIRGIESFTWRWKNNCLEAILRRASPVAWLVKNLLAIQGTTRNAGDPSSVLGLRRSPGEENSNPLQYSCLGNPEEPGGLQSLGLQRVRHDLVTKPPSPPEKRKEKNQPPFFTVQRAGKALKALKLGSEAAAFWKDGEAWEVESSEACHVSFKCKLLQFWYDEMGVPENTVKEENKRRKLG